MGVVKVELVNPSREPVPSELIDEISRSLVAERSVTPHGQDRRWHAHLYPILPCGGAGHFASCSRGSSPQEDLGGG